MLSTHSKKHRRSEPNFAVRHERLIQSLVYVGAAFLVIIVGLRGLGNLSNTTFIPNFILDNEGKIESNIIMIGLLIEFTMLCLLAAVTYFTNEDNRDDLQVSIENLSEAVSQLTQTIPSEVVQKLIQNTQETASSASKLLAEEIEILNNFRTRLDEKIVQIDQDIIQVRKSIAQGIIDSSSHMESFIKKERETIGGYNKLIENLIGEAKETLHTVSKNITSDIKNTFDTSAEAMSRQEKMVTRFYSVNSKLLTEAREGFKRFVDNYSELVERESQRLQQLGANQLRPEEFMISLNNTNSNLLKYLENINNLLKVIMTQQRSMQQIPENKRSFFQKIFGSRNLTADERN
ncbi:hypothetical protein LJE86_18265 [bacterium BMS3Abin03]|nr:hypothetical protein [bacterium BMS3Abin03]MCG6960694.1 hypothetical protein [bacterium BMS3Abin03]